MMGCECHKQNPIHHYGKVFGGLNTQLQETDTPPQICHLTGVDSAFVLSGEVTTRSGLGYSGSF